MSLQTWIHLHGEDRLKIRLSKSSISQDEINLVSKVLREEYLGMGSYVELFEKKLGEYFGREVICCVNGTAALQLALQACGIAQGDEVLVQSLTYVASFQAISACGAKPIACEVYTDSLTIDLDDAQRKMTHNTKAIMPVHFAGGSGNLEAIYKFAKKNNIRVIEDAAHAFGTTYKNKLIGSFGDIACFSFDGIKNITSGEGGCIVTDDPKISENLKDIRLLGVEKDTINRFSGQRSWVFDVKQQGWRYHMSNIMAAIGIVQFEKFPKSKVKRQALARSYVNYLSMSDKITLLDHNYSEVVPHIFPIFCKDQAHKERVMSELQKNDIEFGQHYLPNHLLTYFYSSNRLAITEDLYKKILSLPLHADLLDNQIEQISELVLSVN